jgi:hypothetical protein
LAVLLSIGCLAIGCALLVTDTDRTVLVYPSPYTLGDSPGLVQDPPHLQTIDCGNALHSGPETVYPTYDIFIAWPCKQILATRRLQAAAPLAGGLLLGILTVVATRRAARPDEEGDDLDEAAVPASTP